MTDIDWEAAKSGKRLLRSNFHGGVGRYVGQLVRNRHAVAFKNVLDDNEYVLAYRDDGVCVSRAECLYQDPEVIEFKQLVNVSRGHVEGLFDTYALARMSAMPSSTTVPLTIRITGDKVEIFGGTE